MRVLLFVKQVSDNDAGRRDAPIEVPPGGSFADMVSAHGAACLTRIARSTVLYCFLSAIG